MLTVCDGLDVCALADFDTLIWGPECNELVACF